MTWTLPLHRAARAPARGRVVNKVAEARDEHWAIAALSRRDQDALAFLYDLHSAAVYGLLLRLMDAARAQEVTQDVFLALWERPARYDPARASLRTFLLVSARSRGLDQLRRQRFTTPLFSEDGAELPLPDPAQNPVLRAEDEARRARVQAALTQLSAAHRETVTRAYLQGQSREEIAQAMQVPVGTVKSRLKYALDYLRQLLGGEAQSWLE